MTEDQEAFARSWFERGSKPADIALFFTISDLCKVPPERVKLVYDLHFKEVKDYVYNLNRGPKG